MSLERRRSLVQANVVGVCALECSDRLLPLTALCGELREQLPGFRAVPLCLETAAQFFHRSVSSAHLREQLHVALLNLPVLCATAAREAHAKNVRAAGFFEFEHGK